MRSQIGIARLMTRLFCISVSSTTGQEVTQLIKTLKVVQCYTVPETKVISTNAFLGSLNAVFHASP